MSQANIVSYGDLKSNPEGNLHLNFRDKVSNGAIKVDSNQLSERWYCSYEVRLNDNWTWGDTLHKDGNRFLSNIKIFRMWNPGSVDENVVIALLGWTSHAVWAVEYIGKQSNKFMPNYFDTIKRGVWNKFEFEYVENSGLGVPDGQLRMWFNEELILEETTLITRLKEKGLKRPFLLGFDNMWGPGDGSDNQPNDYEIRNIYVGMDEARPVQDPFKEPEELVSETLEPPESIDMPAWIKTILKRLGEFLIEISK